MYEEYDAKYVINYNPNDIQSIKEASARYARLISSKKGFKDDYCVVQFKPTDNINIELFENNSTLFSFLKSKKNDDKSLEFCMLTETLFFANALRFPLLEDTLKTTAEIIVQFSRDTNDSSEMWITCEEPFAIEWLNLFCSVFPKYGYLLAGFIIPYWDDEHMPESLSELYAWSNNIGITEDTIKAFCYCDNHTAQLYMLEIDPESYYYEVSDVQVESKFDLLTHFRENTDAYVFFKKTLAERFIQQPFLQHNDDVRYYDTNPIRSIISNILLVHHPQKDDDYDRDEFLQHQFVTKSAEEEIQEITEYIEQVNQKAIVPSHQEYVQFLKEIEKKYQPNADLENCWKSFIINSFSNGKELWKYIQDNDKLFSLDTVENVELYQLIDDYDEDLLRLLEQEHIHDQGDLEEDFKRIIAQHLLLWRNKNELKNEKKQLLLRLLDLIFRWNNSKPFEEDLQELLINFRVCSEHDFEVRYEANWFDKLEQQLKDFGGYSDTVTRQHLETCYSLIENKREEAIHVFSNQLFNDNISKEYGVAEILVFSSYLVFVDIENNTADALTEKAKNYINQHLLDAVINDLVEELHFSDLIFSNGKVQPAPQYYQEEEKNKYNQLQEEYTSSLNLLHQKEIQEESIESILIRNLKYDETENISDHQNSINWLDNFSNKTQKLLVSIHYLWDRQGIENIEVLQLILKIAFKVGPVKVIHLIAKVYKTNPYRHAKLHKQLKMLDQLTNCGLSEKGYWGYVMEQFYDATTPQKSQEYKECLAIWMGAQKSSDLIKSKTLPTQLNITAGIKLLPYRLQNNLLKEAQKVVGTDHLKDKYNEALVDYLQRKLKGQFVLNDYPRYFKNRLSGEGIYSESVKWDHWSYHKDLLNTILNEIKIEKPNNLSKEEAQEQLRAIPGWHYFVIKKVQHGYQVVYGEKVLMLLQIGFNIENIYSAQTNCFIIDETCPQQYIDQLNKHQVESYKEDWIQQITSFIQTGKKTDDLENILKYGIDKWGFNKKDDYSETSIGDLYEVLEDDVKQRLLFSLGCISEEALYIGLNLSSHTYYQHLVDAKVDYEVIFKYFITYSKLRNPNIYLLIFNETDGSQLIEKEAIEIQLPMLSIMAHSPKYHTYILGLEKHSSLKIREHVKMLIEKYQLKEKVAQFKIVDFGTYKMLGDTTPEKERKIAQDPLLIKETTEIKAKVGLYFGLRFTAVNIHNTPKICNHTVQIQHPVIKEDGSTEQVTEEWKQNGFSNSNIFLGWTFENEKELIEGEYHMTAFDENDHLIVEKTFVVKKEV